MNADEVSRIDGIVDERLGWARTLDMAQIMADAGLRARLLGSYSAGEDPLPADGVTTEDRVISARGRAESDVSIRVYQPVGALDALLPGLVWAHGGGFAGGSIDDHETDGLLREIAARARAVVVSVDYRLASTGHHHPHLHDEVRTAFEWMLRSDLPIEPGRLFLGGTSAGASLAMAAALDVRDAGENLPAGLILVYPLLYQTTPDAPLPADISDVPGILRLGQDAVDFMFEMYRGPEAGRGGRPYSSLENTDLSRLPPLVVVEAEYDDLRGHAAEIARAATAEGTEAETLLALGLPHGYLQFSPWVPEAERTLAKIAEFVGRDPRASAP